MSDISGVDPPDRDVPPNGSGDERTARPPEDEGSKKHRNRWIWVSAALGLVAIGLLIWALSSQSDLDNAEQEADAAQSQVEQGKKTGGAVLAGGKAAYDDVTQELGATTEDLDATEKDLQDAQKNADKADQKAAAAEQEAAQADNEADKAKAATDKAKAEADAANSKAAVAADCAKAYVSALGTLFEGESVKAQVESVKQQLKSISATCKAALEGA
jgi:chromosome segregation ATPase